MKSYLTLLLAVGTKGLFQDYNPQENQNNLLNNNFKDLNRGVDLNQYFQQLPEDEAKQDLNSAVGRSLQLQDSETNGKSLTKRRRHVADLQTKQAYKNFLNSNNSFEELVAPFNDIALNATQAKQAEQRANRIDFVNIVATMAPQIMIDAKEAVNQNNQTAFNSTTPETRKILKISALLQEQLQCPNLPANLLAFSELTRAEKEKLITGNIAKVDDRFYPRNVFSGDSVVAGMTIVVTTDSKSYSNNCYGYNCLYDLVKDEKDKIDGMPIDKSLANKQNVDSFKTNINQYHKVLASAKAKQEADAKAKQEADAKAKKDVENAEKAKKEAEIKTKKGYKIIGGSGLVITILVALCCCREKIAKCCADGYNLIDEDQQQNDKEGQDRQERPGRLIQIVEMVDLNSSRGIQI